MTSETNSQTPSNSNLRGQIAALLAEDPACGGRVSVDTIDRIAALTGPVAPAGAVKALPAIERLCAIIDGAGIHVVYGREWCAFPGVELRKDLRAALTAQAGPAGADRLREAEDIGLRIAERIRQELTSGRQWSLDGLDKSQREEFEAEIASTCVAVCEQEFAALATHPRPDEAQAQSGAGEVVVYASPAQIAAMGDPIGDESGAYIPLRKTPAGKFTMPLYAHPAPASDAGEVEKLAYDIHHHWSVGHKDEAVAAISRFLSPSSTTGTSQDQGERA